MSSACLDNVLQVELAECISYTLLLLAPCFLLWLVAFPWLLTTLLRTCGTEGEAQAPLVGMAQAGSYRARAVFPFHTLRWMCTIVLVILCCADIGVRSIADSATESYIYPGAVMATLLLTLGLYDVAELNNAQRILCVLIPLWALLGATAGLRSYPLYEEGTYSMEFCTSVIEIVLYFMLTYMDLFLQINCIGPVEQYERALSVGAEMDANRRVAAEFKYKDYNANLPSYAYWEWLTPILRLGNTRPLQLTDLGSLCTEDTPVDSLGRLDVKWGAQLQSGTPSLFWAYFKTWVWPMVYGLVLKIAGDAASYAGPLCLSGIVTYAVNVQSDEEAPVYDAHAVSVAQFFANGYVLAIILLLSTMFNSICLHHYYHWVIRASIQLRASIQAMVFRKALLISNQAKAQATTGAIINHMSTDADALLRLFQMVHYVAAVPFQLTVTLTLLLVTLGPAALAGLAVMILFFVAQTLLAKTLEKWNKRLMKTSDERLKRINEALQGIKIIKLYAWEKAFVGAIKLVRGRQLSQLLRLSLLQAFNTFLMLAAQSMVTLLSFAVFAATADEPLRPEVAFTALALFNMLRQPIFVFPHVAAILVAAKVSTKRLQDFLLAEELPNIVDRSTPPKQGVAIEIEDTSFSWEPSSGLPPTLPSLSLDIPSGHLSMVIGAVGSGKSSLISAMLGEMPVVGVAPTLAAGSVDFGVGAALRPMASKARVRVRAEHIAYCGQKPWLLNASVRDNILFGRPLDQKLYDGVLDAVSLRLDLKALPAEDDTEIGEKGINLSGGQKQRIAIARAIYNTEARIYLFDDPLSALDAHVGTHVLKNAILPLARERGATVVMTTHLLAHLPSADFIVTLQEGRVLQKGSFEEFQSSGTDLSSLAESLGIVEHAKEEQEDDELITPEKKKVTKGDEGKLVEQEERAKGFVKLGVYTGYAAACGTLLFTAVLLLQVATRGALVISDWWLTVWSGDTEGERDVTYYINLYAVLSMVCVILSGFVSLCSAFASVEGARTLHDNMANVVFMAPMAFFDTTPVGRIVNRFSSDTNIIDKQLPNTIFQYLSRLLQIVASLALQVVVTPFYLIPMLPILGLYYYIQRFFRRTSLELQRMKSISLSPVYAYFGETLDGLTTIRAYQQQARYISNVLGRINVNNTTDLFLNTANRWLGVRLDVVGALIVFAAALLCVILADEISPGLIGLAIAYALTISSSLNWLVRATADAEMQMNSVERVRFYTKLDTEPQDGSIDPPADWPSEGAISLDNVTVRYRPHLPPVLKGVTAELRAGTKIGVCGRTGSGKSTLLLSLFRIVECDAGLGSISIDGLNIARVPLESLRSRMSIIPQDPVLFAGTIRFNLDPLDEHTDDSLWESLRTAQLSDVVDTMPGKLDAEVQEDGANLSAGQRQLFCIARAILRRSRITILDEATASVDMQTDATLQEVLRTAFKDRTVITIAHRTATIIDSDYIMVLDDGVLKEFDSPNVLLANEKSIFFSLVNGD